MKGRVLIVAGTDPSGGAGIHADIKATTALGGYAMTAITALVAQNTLGVRRVVDVAPDFIAEQIELCATDIGVDVVKTGMLHRAAVIDNLPQLGRGHAIDHRDDRARFLSIARPS